MSENRRLHHESHSVGGGIYGLLIFGLLLIVAPIALTIGGLGEQVGTMAIAVMLLAGVGFSILASTLIVVAKLYVRTRANEALVKTGRGGIQVIRDGGAIVIPMIHEIVPVSLETMLLAVKREGGADALITKDKLRANIEAQFYLRVEPLDEAIKSAARSLGSRMGDENAVRHLVEDKLISALRNAASVRTLEELNSDREKFTKAVEESIKNDLSHNGLTLESVTISKLDQTDPSSLKENNIFDAQGLRTIAEITQKALTEKNLLVKAGEREREQQNVETKQKLLALQQAQAQAESEQAAQVARIQAEQARIAREKQIESEQAVQIAQQRQLQAVQTATQDKERAVAVATQEKEQAVEVAVREKQAAIAVAEAERALREADQAAAEAKREAEIQGITTVRTKAEADRNREVEVIRADAEARKASLEANQKADANAYRVQKDADAQRAAADAQAEAVRKQADAQAAATVAGAEADARSTLTRKRAEADGASALVEAETAKAMVPVRVAEAQVAVDAQRVAVLLQELEAREKHGQGAQEFELAKLRVEREATVRIETARAIATIHGKMDMTIVGTAEDAAKMSLRYLQGMGMAKFADGFMDTVEGGAAEGAVRVATDVLRRLGEGAAPGPKNGGKTA